MAHSRELLDPAEPVPGASIWERYDLDAAKSNAKIMERWIKATGKKNGSDHQGEGERVAESVSEGEGGAGGRRGCESADVDHAQCNPDGEAGGGEAACGDPGIQERFSHVDVGAIRSGVLAGLYVLKRLGVFNSAV